MFQTLGGTYWPVYYEYTNKMTVVFHRHLEYGKVVLLWIAHIPFVLIADPETVKVWRTYLQKKYLPALGISLTTADEELWFTHTISPMWTNFSCLAHKLHRFHVQGCRNQNWYIKCNDANQQLCKCTATQQWLNHVWGVILISGFISGSNWTRV